MELSKTVRILFVVFCSHHDGWPSNNLGGKPQRTSQICRHTKRPALATLQGSDVAYFGQVLIDIDFKLVRDLLKQRLHRLQVKYYWHIIFVWALLLYLDPAAIIYAWLVPAGFAKLIGSLVFTYSHRNKKANSDLWVGLITLGEGFHDIHHKRPSKKIWHPLDVGGRLIGIFDNELPR